MITNKEAINKSLGDLKKNIIVFRYSNFYTISVKMIGFSLYGAEYESIRKNRDESIKPYIKMATLMFGIVPNNVRFDSQLVYFDYYNEKPAKYEQL